MTQCRLGLLRTQAGFRQPIVKPAKALARRIDARRVILEGLCINQPGLAVLLELGLLFIKTPQRCNGRIDLPQKLGQTVGLHSGRRCCLAGGLRLLVYRSNQSVSIRLKSPVECSKVGGGGSSRIHGGGIGVYA